jgi:hypothetical protein
MPRKLMPGTIQAYGEQVANLGVPVERAAEIAVEVAGLNRAVLEAAVHLDLNDEPAQFALALVRNRAPRGNER